MFCIVCTVLPIILGLKHLDLKSFYLFFSSYFLADLTWLCFSSHFFHSCLSSGYSPAWDVCSLLGQCEGYADLEARQELLAFALTHCPPDSIHTLLTASSDLQTQVRTANLLFGRKKNNNLKHLIVLCTILEF